jgi:DNA repair exonuclease SbcCD ATPase subunit
MGTTPEGKTGEEPNTEDTNDRKGNAEQDAPSGSQSANELLTELTGLKREIGELKSEAAQRRIKARDVEEALKAEREKLLAEQGEWQKLAEDRQRELDDLAPIRERYDALIDNLRKENEERLRQIPEHMRNLIPVDAMTPEQLSMYLTQNWARLTAQSVPGTDAGAGVDKQGKPSPPITDKERKLLAAMGVSEEKYLQEKTRRADER